MKTIIYMLTMSLIYPIWWFNHQVIELIYYIHKKLVRWIEK